MKLLCSGWELWISVWWGIGRIDKNFENSGWVSAMFRRKSSKKVFSNWLLNVFLIYSLKQQLDKIAAVKINCVPKSRNHNS